MISETIFVITAERARRIAGRGENLFLVQRKGLDWIRKKKKKPCMCKFGMSVKQGHECCWKINNHVSEIMRKQGAGGLERRRKIGMASNMQSKKGKKGKEKEMRGKAAKGCQSVMAPSSWKRETESGWQRIDMSKRLTLVEKSCLTKRERERRGGEREEAKRERDKKREILYRLAHLDFSQLFLSHRDRDVCSKRFEEWCSSRRGGSCSCGQSRNGSFHSFSPLRHRSLCTC